MSNKGNIIITPQRAKEIKNKPWLPDLEQLQNQTVGVVNNAMIRAMQSDRLELMLLKTVILIRFGEFNEAFEVSAYATQIPVITIDTIRIITEMWHKLKDELSEDFVDKNEELCVGICAMLERVKKEKQINNKLCNEIINRLNKKKGATDESTETVD
jgi:hypothetical protein